MDYRIFPPEEIIETTVELPVSKSLLNRSLVINALAGNPKPDIDTGAPTDVRALLDGLYPSSPQPCTIDVGASGTAMRFLTARYAALPGADVIIDGTSRMRQRPVAPLVDALRQMGAEIEYLEHECFPPLHIKGKQLSGGTVELDATVSSQFISAILMIAPLLGSQLVLTLKGEPVSKPYIDMTVNLMLHYGAEVEFDGDTITVESSCYRVDSLYTEPDWTAASYWAEIVALSAGFVSLPGLSLHSLQGDVEVSRIFGMLGVDTADAESFDGVEMCAHPEVYSFIDLDLSHNPDLAITIAVTCVLLNIPFRLTGLESLKIKECDRLEALHRELLKFGCETQIASGSISWEGRLYPVRQMPVVDTHDDHRIAMAFAPAALVVPGIVVRNAEVVDKSYPAFWQQLQQAGFTLEENIDGSEQ